MKKTFFTEQMLASLRKSNFPKDFVKDEGHVPDGITMLRFCKTEIGVGYEVDLNLKDPERYEETYRYYETLNNVSVVFWLIRNDWIGNRILQILNEIRYQERDIGTFAFIRLDEFKKELWEAKVLTGIYKGLSIRKVHEKLMQTMSNTEANIGQKAIHETFFSRFKSPQKSTSSAKEVATEIL